MLQVHVYLLYIVACQEGVKEDIWRPCQAVIKEALSF